MKNLHTKGYMAIDDNGNIIAGNFYTNKGLAAMNSKRISDKRKAKKRTKLDAIKAKIDKKQQGKAMTQSFQALRRLSNR